MGFSIRTYNWFFTWVISLYPKLRWSPASRRVVMVANIPWIELKWVSYNPSDWHGMFVGLIHWNNWGELTHFNSPWVVRHQVVMVKADGETL